MGLELDRRVMPFRLLLNHTCTCLAFPTSVPGHPGQWDGTTGQAGKGRAEGGACVGLV